jgi:two-component sensor histidine kinase
VRAELKARAADLLAGRSAPGTFYTEELPQPRKDGSLVWTEAIASFHLNPENGRVEVRGVSRDISERRRNDERLKNLVEIFQHSGESVQDFLDFALEKAIELTGSRIGYIYHYHEERRQFVLNTWSKEVLPACRVNQPQTVYDLEKTGIWGEAVRQRRPIVVNDFPAPNPLKRGYPAGHVELDRFMTVPLIKDGRIEAVIGLGNKAAPYDDTDVLQASLLMDAVWKVIGEMQANEQVRKLLSEKVVLLREVHHRIKNNMTVVCSLLQLQAAAAESGVADALTDAASRVQSMALLYEQLYSSESFSELPLDSYLSSLVRQVVANFPTAGKVALEFSLEPVRLTTARIQPLGIIVNELVTNSMKYAFEGRMSGIIRLVSSRRGDTVVLEVSDNGRGIPPGVEPGSNEGFGLNLIRILTNQIEGRLRLEREGGTRYLIEFRA